jgi:hypothetical protein
MAHDRKGQGQGAPGDIFLKATYIWQIATKWGTIANASSHWQI